MALLWSVPPASRSVADPMGGSTTDGTVGIRTIAWFATALVLSVLATLLVTQAWSVDAAPGDSDSTFVPVAPCRLFDSRPGESPSSGAKTPIGPGESNVRTQQVTGDVGNCVGIPAGATAVSMNVTIVVPTAQSNLRLFHADTPTPTASNLNWLPGQSPTPNKVDVKLSPSGQIKLYNHNGNVDVLADVVGYYTNSTLQEISQRLTSAEARITSAEAELAAAAAKLASAEMSIEELEAGPGTFRYISVAPNGSTVSASQGVSSSRITAGNYRVELDIYVSPCVATATGGGLTATGIANGLSITLNKDASNTKQIFINTVDETDTKVDSEFMVVVFCPA